MNPSLLAMQEETAESPVNLPLAIERVVQAFHLAREDRTDAETRLLTVELLRDAVIQLGREDLLSGI